MSTNQMLTTYRSGIRIEVQFPMRISSDNFAGSATQAFADWLMPPMHQRDQGFASRAHNLSINAEERTLSADVYPEHAVEVLAKAYRLCSRLHFHQVSI